MLGMGERRTPRQVARAATVARIRSLALEQLATDGPAGLSLRAIARQLDLVSSAVYRYYASRDDLITDLVVDAYDDLADHVAHATERHDDPAEAWVAGCVAFRAWAVAEPHRYALVYGSAIPGYVAPTTTIGPATRVVRALLAPFTSTVSEQGVGTDAAGISEELGQQLRTSAAALDVSVESPVMLALVGAFARIQGLVGLELNGHFVGGFEPADDLFETLVRQDAARIATGDLIG